uniref:Uncharacterized protein n=1 Tax=viral metagenome TaxID=1070528 RepID=A0A6C0CIP8_9ZZZZ
MRCLARNVKYSVDPTGMSDKLKKVLDRIKKEAEMGNTLITCDYYSLRDEDVNQLETLEYSTHFHKDSWGNYDIRCISWSRIPRCKYSHI